MGPVPVTLVSSTESAGDAAILTVANGGGFRLDVTTSNGMRGTRVIANYGGVQEENGTLHSLPLVTAAIGSSLIHSYSLEYS